MRPSSIFQSPATLAAMGKITWHKPSEVLPADQEKVLVRCKGQVDLAVYDAKRGVFELRNETRTFSKKDDLEWIEVLRSEGL